MVEPNYNNIKKLIDQKIPDCPEGGPTLEYLFALYRFYLSESDDDGTEPTKLSKQVNNICLQRRREVIRMSNKMFGHLPNTFINEYNKWLDKNNFDDKRELLALDKRVSGKMVNKPCPCGSEKKYKKCCMLR